MKTKKLFIFNVAVVQFLTISFISIFLTASPVSASCFVQNSISNRYQDPDGINHTITSSGENLVLDSRTSSVNASMSISTSGCSGGGLQLYMSMSYLDGYNNDWEGVQETGWGSTNTRTFSINLSYPASITKWSVYYSSAYCGNPCIYSTPKDEWKNFWYMHQNSNTVSSDGKLSAQFVVPWYTDILGGLLPGSSTQYYGPTYYVLVGTDSAVRTNHDYSNIPASSVETQIPIGQGYVTWGPTHSADSSDHGWRVTFNINNFQIPNLNPSTTYYWRLRQVGNNTLGYIPGDSFTTPAAPNPSPSPSPSASPSSCTGNVALTLNPPTVAPGGSVTPTASGLSGCSGKIINFELCSAGIGPCASTGSSCTSSATGCIGSPLITAPSTPKTYNYAAWIDKNGDNTIDQNAGEVGPATLTVSSASPSPSPSPSSPPCTGDISLSLTPQIALPSGNIIAVANTSNLSNCAGKTISFKEGSTQKATCNVPTSGTNCSPAGPIAAPSVTTTTIVTYTASIDKGGGQSSSDSKTVIVSPDANTIDSACGAGINRASGLITTPDFTAGSKFGTSSGACIIDPKAAFVPFKIPAFDDLKSLYYNQK